MLKFFLKALFVLAVTSVVLLFGAYQARQHVPEFYRMALEVEPVIGDTSGDQLEKQALMLNNKVRRDGQWQAIFTDQQINGWLATDLVEKFPDALPDFARNPRVAIAKDRVRIACQYYDGPTMKTVVSVDVDAFLTDQPNEVALRIRKTRAGAIPLPLSFLLDYVSDAARRSEIPLRWVQSDGDPVALVNVPADLIDPEKEIQLESVELRQGELFLSGRTKVSAQAGR